MVAGLRGYQFQGFVIGFSGFAETDRLDAAVPLQGVITEEGLFVTDDKRLGIVSGYVVFQFIHSLYVTTNEETTSCEPNVLIDLQVEVNRQLVLLDEEVGSVGLCHLTDLLIKGR